MLHSVQLIVQMGRLESMYLLTAVLVLSVAYLVLVRVPMLETRYQMQHSLNAVAAVAAVEVVVVAAAE